MKISFSTLGCPRWSWQEIIATAHDLGYQGVEVRGVGKTISVPSVPDFGDDQIEKTMERLGALSLSIPCLDSDCCIHEKGNEAKVQAEAKAYIRLASKLGAPYVRLFAADPVPQPTGPVDEGLVRDQAQLLADYAKPYGVTLLFETHGIWADSEKLARLMTLISSEGVGVLWDIHHPYRYMGEKPADTYQNLMPWLRHVHLKDSVMEQGAVRYKLPGYGDIPLGECVSLLKEHDYAGFYSLEWVKRWDTTLEEPGIVFAHFINYIKSIT